MSIIHKHVDEIFEYDGSQINPSWAFQEFGIYGSSIVTWIGPVNITPDNLKDFADVGLEIKSNYMVNFICEFFDQQPPNMRIAYLRQRLLVMIFREILTEYGIETKREGDDIFVDGGKLSISIASVSLSSAKIHFALNLEDKGTPDDVETIGLFDIKDENGVQIFSDDNLLDLINKTASRFIEELETIENDISKTKVLL
ncbi:MULTISPECIES: DUF366 family protein [Methanobrevibacter]|uniref:DUF366 family protein n=1 Tax=Methanobrevibacter TaxID=2172 RepID=UPI0025FA7C88|nr:MULTISPECIES: DUF366 family protein [Methanobrevibacter]MBS7258241.1 DUF366 family protein [Methanobrevibacter sp.]MCI7428007.1 DUF366 family protein [Methanobrevibacter sp.]MDD6776344.1 DUF366 family protein [Methanobacteriaceae archaeon]MDY3096901.1 DUF366 family protein [Methanobrevibacter sp.]